MDRFFKISERGSSVATEVIAGLTMFLACVYIVAVNPIYLLDAGIPLPSGLTATCLGAGIMTLAMGLIANRPVALASGMGLNAVVVYNIAVAQGVDWRVAMACVFVEGIIILILVLCGLRELIMKAIPASLRDAIGIGIGLFIAFLGFKGAGLVVYSETDTILGMGNLGSPTAIVGIVSIFTAVVLHSLDVRGGLIISIIVGTIVGIPLGVTIVPDQWTFGFDLSAFAAPFQPTPTGEIAILDVFFQPMLLMFVFSLIMSDFFDTMGALFAIGRKADFIDENDEVKDLHAILVVDSAAAAVGGFLGASSVTTYAESTTAGVAGGRTGLVCVVAGVLFLLCPLLAPLFGMVSSAATSGALLVVGYLMLSDIANLTWDDPAVAFSSAVTILGIPFTYSITDGIGFGFISYVVIRIFQGRIKDIHPLMWVATAAFLVAFVLL